MLPYEKLQAKGEAAPSVKGDVSELIGVLSDLNKDKESAFYGKLGDYASAISMIIRNSSYKKREKDVKKAMETLEPFNDFLISGEDNTAYQELVNEASTKLGKSPDQIDKALNSFSTFVQMGLDLDKIKAKQAELDKNNVGLIDDGQKLTNAAYFEKRTAHNKTFASKPNEKKAVTALKDIFSSAVITMEEQINSYEKKVSNKNSALTDADREAYEQNKALVDKVKQYAESMTILNGDIGNQAYSTLSRQSAMDNLQDLQTTLEEGAPVTNLKWIVKQANKEQPNKSADKIEDTISKGLKALDNTLHYGFDASKAQEIKKEYKEAYEKKQKEQKLLEAKKSNKHTAANWLEGYKADMEYNKKGLSKTYDPYPASYFATIMAVREIADVKRNQPSKLIRDVQSQYQIEQKRDEFLKSPAMKGFFDKLASDPKFLAKAEKEAAKGHCGGVDTLMHDYLTNLPAGQLSNDPALKRFMPTVKERIEALQTQAKASLKKHETPYAQAAEIVILRNMVKAERKFKDSLDLPIPLNEKSLDERIIDENTAGKKEPAKNELAAAVQKLANRKSFQSLVQEEKVSSALKSGHGGQMVTEMRNHVSNHAGREGFDEANASLQENTFDGRLKQIKTEAAKLKSALDALEKSRKKGKLIDGDDYSAVFRQSREIIAENIALNQYLEKNQKIVGADNIPWRKIHKLRDEIIRNDNMNSALFGAVLTTDLHKPDKIGPVLDALSTSKDTRGFYNDHVKEKVEQWKTKTAQAEQEKTWKAEIEAQNNSPIKETRTTRRDQVKAMDEKEFNQLADQMADIAKGLNQGGDIPNAPTGTKDTKKFQKTGRKF